jgi:hypothetical protein
MFVDIRNLAASVEPSERTPDVERPVREGDQPSQVVVEAMAEALDTDIREISPLYGTVDPNALDALFGRRHDGTLRTGGCVAFDHGECRAVVESDRVSVFVD